MYICLAAALDSDLWTLFPVESHVERSERGCSHACRYFLVSVGQRVKIKLFNGVSSAKATRQKLLMCCSRHKPQQVTIEL